MPELVHAMIDILSVEMDHFSVALIDMMCARVMFLWAKIKLQMWTPKCVCIV